MTEPTPLHPSAASAARRATADPGVFLIPEAALPPGFAERVEAGTAAPVAPRAAATVLLARDGARGPELLLLRRHGRSGFAADAWVFPGGMVDEDDCDAALAARLDGPSPAAWGARLGTPPAEAAAFVAAALREAFEETGILLAAPAPPPATLEAERRALLAGETGLRALAERHGLRLDARSLAYVAHWITPEPEPRRYDTRFFLARLPADAVCVPHRAEMVDAAWLTAAEAVRRFEDDALHLLPPTIHTLRRLLPFPSVGAMLAALADLPVPRILPVMRRRADGVAIVVPADAAAPG